MGTFIHGYTILNAIKALIDADAQLKVLLAAKEGASKVTLGVERPPVANLPCIHLSIMTRDINPETKYNVLLLRVSWFVNQLPDGSEDTESLSDIGERIYDLLDDSPPTVSGYRIDLFSAESGEAVAKDLEEPEGRDNHFESLTFRMGIRRIS